MSWAGGPNPGAGKQPNQGIQVCLIQEGPVEGRFAHGAVVTLTIFLFVLQVIRDVCKVSFIIITMLFFFFVIPLSLLKGECVFLWEE